MTTLWLGSTPLVLASQSSTRRALLEAAGLPVETCASGIDERTIEAPLIAKGADAAVIAAHLARAKAQAVAERNPDRLVLGADQTLSLDARLYTKPADRAAARAQLLSFAGRTHELHSALCVMRGTAVLYETIVTARLTCRAFSGDFIDRYIEAAGDSVLSSVGAYQLEGLGIHLFEKIDGDHPTILGLPLLPLLDFLRRAGWSAG